MDRSRRSFIKSAGLGFLALGLPPSFLVRAAGAQQSNRGKVLMVVFQRGGMDGLNVVVPFKDGAYYALRPSIAVAEPAGGEERAIDLDGYFALHPALAPLKNIYDKGHLAILHAAGSPDNTRSHFDAQDYMEIGTPGVKSTPDGWLNRYLNEKRLSDSPFRGVAVGAQTPRMLAGAAPSLSLSSIEEFRLRNQTMAATLQKLYTNSTDPLFRQGGNSLFDAMARLRTIESKIPPSTASYPAGKFAVGLKQIARLIKAHVGLEIAFTEIEGWDTHVAEGGATGILANRLKEFGAGLAAFYQDLGDRLDDVVVVTMSEFGRTARENGNRGTDHGHANVMFILGGRVRGGKVYGRWPGLAPEVLYEGRDLDLTTDYRTVCSEVFARHLGQREVGRIFPGFRPATFTGLLA
ncbi:MAG TPA: DUF1501 domain-containing protein [Candidatus Binatia bacterium]|jgi:uncharacterized protein (DUF1501 family)|nr:DUF1501 domain-containing protein [Candidatus Binatia bacterium]